jgi:orotidine-5'-phosphate decarboxylase
MSALSSRDRLAVALDVPTLDDARSLIDALAGASGWLKVGGELFTAAGPAALEAAAATARVFLDTKFHDIPNTVARSVAAATHQGVAMLTLHASGGSAMMRAARDAAGEAAAAAGVEAPCLLGVTVLTSLSPSDLKEVGIETAVEDQVARLVDLALESGIGGVVASPLEAAMVRRRAGEALRIVTPGIRSSADAADDQARTATPGSAIEAGADVLVVGRPVVRASDPRRTATALVAEIERALAARA